jgi:hypothetical protein
MQQDRRSRQRQTPWNGQDRDSAVTVARLATGPRRHRPQANRGKWRWGAATTVPVPVRGGALHADDGSVRSSELEEQQKATPSCLFPTRSLAPPAPAASSCMPVPVPVRCNKTAQRALCSRSGLAGCCCAAQRCAACNLPSADSENKLAPAFLPSCRCMAPSLLHRPYLLGVMIA